MPVTLSLRANVLRNTSRAGELTVVVTALYQRTGSGSSVTDVPLATDSVVLGPTKRSLSLPLRIDVSRCLVDMAPIERCPIILAIRLRQGAATADSVRVGPVDAAAGATATLTQPVELRETAQLQLTWPGSSSTSSGDTLRAGRPLQLTATTRDATGAVLLDKSVSWSTASPNIATVDATTGLVTPLAPGLAVITASAGGRSSNFTANIYASADVVEIVSGDEQRLTPGATVPIAPVVRVVDRAGRPSQAALVTFTLTGGGGQYTTITRITDSQGRAFPSGTWVTGSAPAVNVITASAAGATPAIVRAYGTIPAVHDVLAVGAQHGCILDVAGIASCWGSNQTFGTLGIPLTTAVSQRGAVPTLPPVQSLKSRGPATCGVQATGAAYCWGRNYANMSRGSGNTSLVATAGLMSGGPWKVMSPARLTSCGLTVGNIVQCIGINQSGEVGDGTTVQRNTFTTVITALTFESLEASWFHTCALTFAGAAYCWGAWKASSLGERDTLPTPVSGGIVFRRLYSGSVHTCGLDFSGNAYCWGPNQAGQLGNGTASVLGPPAPTAVRGGLYFSMLSTSTIPGQADRLFTCGITITGKAYCWGANDVGQLGNGTTTSSFVPVPVNSNEVFIAIGAGDSHACAMTPDRRVFCWGSNVIGELGSGTIGGFSAVPVIVP